MFKTYYFVCLSFLLIVTDVARCEPDYVLNFEAGGWFKLYSTPETWEEAFIRCYHDGAVLASPLNKELAKALLSQLAQFGVSSHIFLGTHDLLSKGIYVSVEGVLLSDIDISWGSHGNGTDTGDCLTMSVDGSAYFSSCKERLPFMCYRKIMKQCGKGDRIEDVFNIWYSGEPNNLNGVQDRGLLTWSGKLDDISEVEGPRPFVCEKPPKPEGEDSVMNIFPV